MPNKYNMRDMEQFVADYDSTLFIRPKKWMIRIPFFGVSIYEKTLLEEQKRVIFRGLYNKAVSDEIDQEEYIEKMTPVLDEFYSKRKMKRR